MYNLIEYSNNYSKTFWTLWQYYRCEPNSTIANSELLKSNTKITGIIQIIEVQRMLK